MSKRKRVLFVSFVLAIGLTMAAVPGATAQSSVTVDAESGPVDLGTETETHSVTVENRGNNSVSLDISSPSGIDVDPEQRSVPGGSTRTIDLEISGDDDASGGTVTVSAGGDSDSFQVDRLPIAGLEDEPLDTGDVLVGGSTSGEADIEELTGEGGLSYASATVVSTDPDADLGVSVSGTTLNWNVYADSGVDQHEDLEWEVELEANGDSRTTRTVEVESRVIYPAEFGEVTLDDEMTFDEPRGSSSTITKTVDLDVENSGDLELDLDGVTAYASNRGLDVSIADRPDTIDGQSTGTVELAVTADTGLSEGTYDVTGSVSAADFSVSDASYDGTVDIEHGTELDVPSRIDLGDVPIGEPERRSTTVGESLGYNDVENFELSLEDGPDRWLTVEESPSRLAAGDSGPVVFGMAFEPDAEVGTSYEWTYVVDGAGVEEETVTVTASPVPLDLGPIRSEVSSYDGTVADRTVSMIDTMDERSRSGDVSGDDITRVLSYGSAASLYLESMETARERQAAGEYKSAQREIVQAAAAYNTMTLYANELEGDAFRADSSAVVAAAESDLDAVIAEQEAYYEDRLESENVSLIEEATVQRQLARVALLQGDDERAATLESDAESAFESYTESVSAGERARQRADETWAAMETEQFLTIAGQPLFLNPAEYDAYDERVDEMNAAYENATATFEDAGEASRAEAVTAEYEQRASALQVTRWSLFGAVAVYAALVVGIVFRTARGMYWYLRDARESVSGDFLV
ncbi:hypothetical protein [Natrinema versiforme]|uniref:Uncharacterized protein n=1 Tax=Natrinema versiforme TaxID=88724 RepID=A0A4V1FXN0_9EURY|nr:hypothetical protein [Natrinema versiforme]QCS41031.1 hypothetical protein FEJ81_01200 [Natrinema versiforme]